MKLTKSKKFRELPEFVKTAWWYSGKEMSVHIQFKPFIKEVVIADGVVLKVLFEVPQLNLCVVKKRKPKRGKHGKGD